MKMKCGWCEIEFDSLEDSKTSKHEVTISHARTTIRCLD